MGYCQGRPQDASRRPFGRLKGGRPRHSPLCGNGWADDEAPSRCCAPGLLLWRRWGDSNSRGASTPTSLAGRRTRPLCDISIAFPQLRRGTHGQPTGRTPLRANRGGGAPERTPGQTHEWISSPQPQKSSPQHCHGFDLPGRRRLTPPPHGGCLACGQHAPFAFVLLAATASGD